MLTSRRRIGFMQGAPRLNSAVVLVTSFLSSAVTVTCNGQSQSVALAQIGLLYYGHATFTGLVAATRYPVTLTQSGVTESDCSVLTNCAASTRCLLWYASCDNPTNEFGGMQSGGYSRIAQSVRDNPIPQYMLFADDYGYPSRQTVNDTILGIAHSDIPATSGLAADYALSYANNLGMFDDTSDANIRWGLNTDRNYCTRNMPWCLQIGDWEIENDRGWDAANDADGLYVTAIGVWNALFGPLRPETDIRNRDTTALHWGITIGATRIVAMDNITNGSGGYVDGTTAITTQFGSNQIDDCLDALNTDDTHKLLIVNLGDRYLGPAATADEFRSGQQHPLFNHCLAEYQQLYTATGNTPPSLMDNPKTNGTTGGLSALHGDTHRGAVYNNQAVAYAGNAAENWWSWYIGTINGCINFGLLTEAVTNCVDGGSYGGTSVVYTQESGVAEHAHHRWHTLSIDVRGDLATTRIDLQLKDESKSRCAASFIVGDNQPSSR